MPAPLNEYVMTGMLADVSTASSHRFCIPYNGFLRRIETTLGGAITGADSVITASLDNSALSPTITVANASSAEGDRDVADYNVAVRAGQWLEIATGGESTGTQQLGITVTLRR